MYSTYRDGVVLKDDIKIILFDLGGVLVTWKGVEGLRDFSGGKMTLEESRLFWLNSEWVRRFERGRCHAPEFVKGVLGELDFKVSEERVLEAFLEWDRGPMPGALELLSDLRGSYQLACLSNNEEIHWNRLKSEYNADQLFDKCYLSHEIAMIKPDPEIYDYVIDDLGIDPSGILFFDDNPECVDAARESGMLAYVTKGVGEVRSCLEELGVLPLEKAGACSL